MPLQATESCRASAAASKSEQALARAMERTHFVRVSRSAAPTRPRRSYWLHLLERRDPLLGAAGFVSQFAVAAAAAGQDGAPCAGTRDRKATS